jgi:hypothetical protein
MDLVHKMTKKKKKKKGELGGAGQGKGMGWAIQGLGGKKQCNWISNSGRC